MFNFITRFLFTKRILSFQYKSGSLFIYLATGECETEKNLMTLGIDLFESLFAQFNSPLVAVFIAFFCEQLNNEKIYDILLF